MVRMMQVGHRDTGAWGAGVVGGGCHGGGGKGTVGGWLGLGRQIGQNRESVESINAYLRRRGDAVDNPIVEGEV